MKKQKHPAGLWKWIDHHCDNYEDDENMGAFVTEYGVEICNFGNCTTYYPSEGKEPSKPNIDRILASVNAMAGIEEPEKWVKDAKDAIEALQQYKDRNHD